MGRSVFYLKTSGFILYHFGMNCIYFQNGFLFLFFLASFIMSFLIMKQNLFSSTMLYVIVFKIGCELCQRADLLKK